MKKIVYKGRELPCRMTMGAMVRFKNLTGRDVSALSSGDIADLIVLLWCCVKSACNADGIPFEEPFEFFADSLEADSLSEFVSALSNNAEEQKKSPEEAK
ncbi:MAG: hypothetical protein J6N54_06585 [Bacteroidales bacterium]|nr:hypothetical protein [Bacteroidales bacterium]